MATTSEDTKPKGPAAAARRKRRIALRKQAAATDGVIEGSDSKRVRIMDEVLDDPETDKPKPSITGIKKHHRYQPGVPMTKDELKNWRKEARRVRNRESAAASRKRNRALVDQLEFEVEALKSKYAAALKYIMNLEGCASANGCFTPETLRQDLRNMATECGAPVSPELSLTPQPVEAGCAPLSSRVPFSLNTKENHYENVTKNQHIMISNIAVS